MSREEDRRLAAAGVSEETWQQRVRSLQAWNGEEGTESKAVSEGESVALGSWTGKHGVSWTECRVLRRARAGNRRTQLSSERMLPRRGGHGSKALTVHAGWQHVFKLCVSERR